MGKRQYRRRETVIEVRVGCPSCQCTRRRVVQTERMPTTPLLHEGKLYPGRTRRVVVCENPDCGQHYIINEPLNEVTQALEKAK